MTEPRFITGTEIETLNREAKAAERRRMIAACRQVEDEFLRMINDEELMQKIHKQYINGRLGQMSYDWFGKMDPDAHLGACRD